MARKKIPAVPTLTSWEDVNQALRDIRECNHSLKELEVVRDRAIDESKAAFTEQATPLMNKIKELEVDVKTFVDAHRAELEGKSRNMVFGVVGYRISHKLMLAPSKVAEAIQTLKRLGRYDLIKTSETIDREGLKKQPEELLVQVGAYIRPSDEFYYDLQEE